MILPNGQLVKIVDESATGALVEVKYGDLLMNADNYLSETHMAKKLSQKGLMEKVAKQGHRWTSGNFTDQGVKMGDGNHTLYSYAAAVAERDGIPITDVPVRGFVEMSAKNGVYGASELQGGVPGLSRLDQKTRRYALGRMN